jgi:hypothetical protein
MAILDQSRDLRFPARGPFRGGELTVDYRDLRLATGETLSI